jgi:predicted transcriptional regulator
MPEKDYASYMHGVKVIGANPEESRLHHRISACCRLVVAIYILFFLLVLASPLYLHMAYADQANINTSYENTYNHTYNMTNGQIAELEAMGAQFYPNGYIITPGNPANYTPEERSLLHMTDADLAAMNNSTGPVAVSFWQLPTWIQISFLSGSLVALAGAITLFPLVVRKIRSPMDNENRKSVLNYIHDNPGCTAPEVSRDQGMNMGTVRYHIQRLELGGKIILKKIGKFSRIYRNASTYNGREMVIASHLRNETSRKLLQATFETPGMTNQALAERFNIDKSTVYVHMQKLLDDDIIFSEVEGKQKRYFVQESAKPVIIKFMPLNYQCPGMKWEDKT